MAALGPPRAGAGAESPGTARAKRGAWGFSRAVAHPRCGSLRAPAPPPTTPTPPPPTAAFLRARQETRPPCGVRHESFISGSGAAGSQRPGLRLREKWLGLFGVTPGRAPVPRVLALSGAEGSETVGWKPRPQGRVRSGTAPCYPRLCSGHVVLLGANPEGLKTLRLRALALGT